jgi:hypothetical protein
MTEILKKILNYALILLIYLAERIKDAYATIRGLK